MDRLACIFDEGAPFPFRNSINVLINNIASTGKIELKLNINQEDINTMKVNTIS